VGSLAGNADSSLIIHEECEMSEFQEEGEREFDSRLANRNWQRDATWHEVERLKDELELERYKSDALSRSFSYQLGSLLVQAVCKPGSNTVLLPYRLLRLMRLADTNSRDYINLIMANAEEAIARKDWPVAYRRSRQGDIPQEAREQIAAKLPMREYGSFTDGIGQWDRRWKEASANRRVLMVAPKDFAGSMYKLAEALNRYTSYAVRLVTFDFHQFNYPVDLVVPECDDDRLEAFFKIAREAAIFHLKDEHSWFLGREYFLNLRLLNVLFFSNSFRNTRKVFTHYGGYARKLKDNAKYIARVQRFDGRIAMTPDLNFDWFNGEYVPHAIDTDLFQKTWRDSNIIAHSPSNVLTKATYLLEGAVDILDRYHQDVWRNWFVDIIRGISYYECMLRKSKASLFFEQAGGHGMGPLGIDDIIGWYGNSAVEAMTLGIPTIAHLSEVAFERAEKAGHDIRDLPVINTPRAIDGLAETILHFAIQSPREREALSERTRQFAVDFHGYASVGKRMAEIYDRLLV